MNTNNTYKNLESDLIAAGVPAPLAEIMVARVIEAKRNTVNAHNAIEHNFKVTQANIARQLDCLAAGFQLYPEHLGHIERANQAIAECNAAIASVQELRYEIGVVLGDDTKYTYEVLTTLTRSIVS